MFMPRNKLIKEAQKREAVKENSSVKDGIVSMGLIGTKVEFQRKNIGGKNGTSQKCPKKVES